MNLNLNLNNDKSDKGRKVLNQERDKKFQPTWQQIWFEGYTRHTGTHKQGIFQSKLTDPDRERLEEVKKAIEEGIIGTGVDDMKKFTKAHALRLYKQLKEQTREQTIEKMVKEKPSNYTLVVSEFELGRLMSLMQNEVLIAVDTETTGLDPFGDDQIVGVSISLDEGDEHFYIPVRHNTDRFQLSPDKVFKELKAPLEDPTLNKALHNAKFDAHMLKREGINLQGIFMDTMVSFHILNENEPSYALKNLATKWGKHFGFEDKSATYEELFGKGGFQDTPLDIATVYACKDTHLTLKFAHWILGHLNKQPRLKDIHRLETEVLKVVIQMEQNGFLIDQEFVKDYMEVLVETIAQLEEELKEHFGDINLNSPQQLQKALFEDLGLPDRNNGSVDASTLKALQGEHEGVAKLLQYRETTKLLGTYIEPLPKKVSKVTGRLHGQFKQSGTVTGRFSSSDPNLQNIPYLARKLFIAPEGKLLMGCDFSKVEPTILAHMSGDDKFKRPFLEGVDIYSSLASGTFHKPIEECGDGSKERKMMKTGLLATMYGTSMWTLAEQLDISVEEAEEFIQRFLSKYPVVAQWIEEVHNRVDREGYVETLFGRKRRFIGHPKKAERFHKAEAQIEKRLGRKSKNIWDEPLPYKVKKQFWDIAKDYHRASRQSVNAIIQGTGADIMKKALVSVHQLFEFWNTGSRQFKIVGTVHDEILMEVPEDILESEVEQIENAMKTCVSLSLPLKVDTELMTRWGEGKSKEEHFKGVK